MSRWSNEFENHPIRETVNQLREYANVDIEGLTSESLAELRRFRRVLYLIERIINCIDPDFAPISKLDELNQEINNYGIVGTIEEYSDGNIESLTQANDDISNLSGLIYQMLGMVKQPQMRNLATSYENSLKSFLDEIEEKNNEFIQNLKSNSEQLTALKGKTEQLEKNNQNLNSEFTKHQQHINEQQENVHEEWNEKLATVVAEIEKSGKSDWAEAVKKYNESLQNSFNSFLSDMNAKRKEILELHGLIVNDVVAGGYAENANKEKKVADWWRGIAMFFYFCMIGSAGYALFTQEFVGEFNFLYPISRVASFSLPFFIVAQFALRQSLLHRTNESRMRWFSLETQAFSPFIESLGKDAREELKKDFTRHIFGQNQDFQQKPKSSWVQKMLNKSVEKWSNPEHKA